MKAIWNNRVIAESDSETFCHWKGTASYFNLKVEDHTNQDAAWYYSDPMPLADGIRGRIAFWKGVRIVNE